MSQKDGLEARQDMIEAQNEFGSTIEFIHIQKEVWDDNYENIITPESRTSYPNRKAFIKNVATDKMLSKMTDDEKQSYSLYMKLYTELDINKEDWIVKYLGEEYVINFIDSSQIQDVIYKFEILLKK